MLECWLWGGLFDDLGLSGGDMVGYEGAEDGYLAGWADVREGGFKHWGISSCSRLGKEVKLGDSL